MNENMVVYHRRELLNTLDCVDEKGVEKRFFSLMVKKRLSTRDYEWLTHYEEWVALTG